MQKRDQAVLAALVIGLLIGAAATYALTGSLSRTSTTTTTLAAVTRTTTTTVSNLANVTSSSESNSTLSTGGSSSTISPSPCALSYRVPPNNITTLGNGTQVTESAEPAFVVTTGSTMDLCIEFVDPANTNRSVSTPTELSLFLWPDAPSVGFPPAKNVSSTATPENISLSAGQSTVVEYTFSTGKNSTAFDGAFVDPLGALDCQAIPIAVGYQPSQVNSSDFSSTYYHGITSCPLSGALGLIIGYTGASVVYLTEETRG